MCTADRIIVARLMDITLIIGGFPSSTFLIQDMVVSPSVVNPALVHESVDTYLFPFHINPFFLRISIITP